MRPGSLTKSWIFLVKKDGRQRALGMGGYPATSLALARQKAADCRSALAEGRDPFAEARREATPTFGACAARYVESHGKAWKNWKTEYQWTTSLAEHCEQIWSTRVSDVDVPAVLSVLTPIWQRTPATAGRVRNRIEAVLDYAKAHNWRAGENPARWKGGLAHLLPKRVNVDARHHRALDYRDLPAFMSRLRGVNSMTALALQFTVLTAARSGEVRNAKWDEIDLDAGLWTVPGERMKAGRAHQVPLSSSALDLLKTLRALGLPGQLVFPGHRRGKPLAEAGMIRMLGRMKVDVTVHGFRRPFATGRATKRTSRVRSPRRRWRIRSAPPSSGAYRRGSALEKRRQLMQAWAELLDGASGEAKGEIVQLPVRSR